MRTIVLIRQLPEVELSRLKEIACGWKVVDGIEEAIWKPRLRDAEIIALAGWNDMITQECLTKPSRLRWIHTLSSGIDRVPIEELKRRNILLTCSRGVYAIPIAESVMTMILSMARHFPRYYSGQLKKKWIFDKGGSELYEKTIGILGVGGVGTEIAKRAKGFGMNVVGLRKSGIAVENVDYIYDFMGLSKLLSESDFVVNTLPHTPLTDGLINYGSLCVMKSSAYYFNVGRGKTTVTDDLVRILQEGRLAGAGLDVFEEEPLSGDSPLWNMSNVLITPHAAGTSDREIERMMICFTNYVKKYVSGKAADIPFVQYENYYY